MTELCLSGVRLVPARAGAEDDGLIGFVSFLLAPSLRIDGVALRRTRDGRHVLSFPARRDGHGRDHPYIRPLDDAARESIERQVLDALGLGARR